MGKRDWGAGSTDGLLRLTRTWYRFVYQGSEQNLVYLLPALSFCLPWMCLFPGLKLCPDSTRYTIYWLSKSQRARARSLDVDVQLCLRIEKLFAPLTLMNRMIGI